MAAKLGVLALALIAIIGCGSALDCGKCGEVLSKELYSYLGSIHFKAPKRFDGHWNLEIKTDAPYTFIGGWGVIVESDGNNKTAKFQSANEVALKAGEPISFDFRIRWDPDGKIPKVQQISWEGLEICKGVDPTSENAIKKRSSKSRGKMMSRKYGIY